MRCLHKPQTGGNATNFPSHLLFCGAPCLPIQLNRRPVRCEATTLNQVTATSGCHRPTEKVRATSCKRIGHASSFRGANGRRDQQSDDENIDNHMDPQGTLQVTRVGIRTDGSIPQLMAPRQNRQRKLSLYIPIHGSKPYGNPIPSSMQVGFVEGKPTKGGTPNN